MAGEDLNMLTMMCTKICTIKTDECDFEMYMKEYSKGPFHLKYHRVYMKHIDL